MGAGGSADAMKFSDVLILVGVGVLCAGFIIHGWVETTSIDYAENPEYSKSLTLLDGDKVEFNVECISQPFLTTAPFDCSGNVIIYDGLEEPTTQPYQLMEGEKFTYTFDSKDLEWNNKIKFAPGAKFKAFVAKNALLEIGAMHRWHHRTKSNRTKSGSVFFLNWSTSWDFGEFARKSFGRVE